MSRSIVVFDLGGVLIDWNPRYMYRKLFAGDEAAMEHFLATVCTQSWNEQQDAGRTFAEGCAILKKVHPEQSDLIDAWLPGYEEMLGGAIEGSVAILSELRARNVLLYALSNWSAETFPVAWRLFPFLSWFEGVMLSGEVKFLKPDPRIFQLLLQTYEIDPARAIFVDDHAGNVEPACKLGMHGIHFNGPDLLRSELRSLGVLSQA